jgi:hypothetical protein
VLYFDSTGRILDLKASGGSQGLRHEAELAARGWEFKDPPEKLSVLFSFVLHEKGADRCRPSLVFATPFRVEICEERKEIDKISDPPMVDLSKPIGR